jgi:hypothetical protein
VQGERNTKQKTKFLLELPSRRLPSVMPEVVQGERKTKEYLAFPSRNLYVGFLSQEYLPISWQFPVFLLFLPYCSSNTFWV